MARHVVKAIQDWNVGLLPDDRHDKYCDMSSSPFVFYRGSNALINAIKLDVYILAGKGFPAYRYM